MLYKITAAIIRSPDSDTDSLAIVPRVFKGNILASFLFTVDLDYILQMSIDQTKENGNIKKGK